MSVEQFFESREVPMLPAGNAVNHCPAPSATRARSRPAFTLVELLVVIGIVVILISLLLPVISKARDEGMKTGCISNLRQITGAMFMYANDNKGYLPRINDSFTKGAGTTTWDADIFPYLANVGVYQCPAQDLGGYSAPPTGIQFDGTNYVGPLSYMANGFQPDIYNSPITATTFTRTNIQHPPMCCGWSEKLVNVASDTILLTEEDQAQSHIGNPSNHWVLEIKLTHHWPFTCFAFADGSAAAVKNTTILGAGQSKEWDTHKYEANYPHKMQLDTPGGPPGLPVSGRWTAAAND